jgi:hypothetical protein
MDNMNQTFGDYTESGKDTVKGRLLLGFQSATLNLDELWESSALSAKYLSTFWGNFFPEDHSGKKLRKNVTDKVLYACGELLGNAVKFNYHPEYLIDICLFLHHDELRIYVSNSVRQDDVKKFEALVRRIVTEDTNMLFLEQMERNAAEEGSGQSGIGILTMINDYGLKLSWKFSTDESGVVTVTTLARLPIVKS